MTELMIRPGDLPTPDQLIDLTEYWLVGRKLTNGTRANYRRGVHGWLDRCTEIGVHPFAAKFTHVNAYIREMEADQKPGTVGWKVTGISQWYQFLIKLEILTVNPVEHADRPEVVYDPADAFSLTEEDTDRLLAEAAAHSPRSWAMFTLMADLALRVTPTIELQLSGLKYVRGEWTLQVVGKRGMVTDEPLPPETAEPLFSYLEGRAEAAGVTSWQELNGPIFVTRTGKPVDRVAVWRLIRDLAEKAGMEGWERVGPHVLKHGFVTNSREAGIPLEDVQDGAHHRSVDTTRGYDTRRHRRERHPAWTLTARRAARREASNGVVIPEQGA